LQTADETLDYRLAERITGPVPCAFRPAATMVPGLRRAPAGLLSFAGIGADQYRRFDFCTVF
jgi:hypothetical protein